jgi:hypothetical protein
MAMWLEIIPTSNREKIKEKIGIEPEPKIPFEIRLVIWEVQDIPPSDIKKGESVFVGVSIDGFGSQHTDIHYNIQNGYASYNWRMVFKCDLPQESFKLKFKIFNKDMMSENEFLSGTNLNCTK